MEQRLASCPSLFLSWMRRARVALMESAPEDVMSQFDNLCQFKVPRALYEVGIRLFRRPSLILPG